MNNNKKNNNENDVVNLKIYQKNMELLVLTTKFFNETEGKSIHPLAHILLEKIADGSWNYLTALNFRETEKSFNKFISARNCMMECISVIDIIMEKSPELKPDLERIMEGVDILIKMVNWSLNTVRLTMKKIAA